MSEFRRNDIFDKLRVAGQVNLFDLAREFQVSAETIRRDLKKMAKEGIVELVRGGAALPDVLRDAAFQHCLNEHAPAKRAIAAAAVSLVENGDRIMLGGGSTTTYLALALRDHRELTVITNSVDAARILAARGNNEIYTIGGKLDNYLGSTVGSSAIENIHRFNADKMFFSASGLSQNEGFASDSIEEATCWSAMIHCSRQVNLLLDSSKFQKQSVFKCADFHELDTLVSESAPPATMIKSLKAQGCQVILADELEPEAGNSTAEKGKTQAH